MSNNEWDFKNESISDEEIEDMLDKLILPETEDIECDEDRTSIINLKGIKAVFYAYKALCYLTKGTSAKVTYELHNPYKSMGSVSVIGKNLAFNKPEWFMAAVKLASNFDVYPKTNGTVQMDFTFHGLTIPIE